MIDSGMEGLERKSSMKVSIRHMTSTDYTACQRVAVAAARSSYAQFLSPELLQKVTNPASPLDQVELRLIAEVNGSVAGFVEINGSHIETLFVDPQYQGMGVGADLLNAAERCVEGDVTLSVFTVNPRARAFYERHGYMLTGTKEVRFHGVLVEVWTFVKRRR